MSEFEKSQQWLFGNQVEKERRDDLAKSGETVFPLFAMKNGVEHVTAPMVLAGGGLIVCADLLVSGRSGAPHLEEVKAKTQPGWARNANRWEHGIDYARFESYWKLQRTCGMPILLVIRELNSPTDETCFSRCVPPGCWLIGTLAEISRCPIGKRIISWPSKTNRGLNGQGGWLFARSALAKLDPRNVGQLSDVRQRAIKTEAELEKAFEAARARGRMAT